MKKILIMIISLFIIVCGILLFFWLRPNIDGYLSGYEKFEDNFVEEYIRVEDNSFNDFIGIEEGIIGEIRTYPEKYSVYWIDTFTKNTTGHMVYDLKSKLSKPYSNVWLVDPFAIYDFVIDFAEHEVSEGWGFIILVKTDNMSENEIDELIRSIGITINARNTINAPVYASNTIYFKDPANQIESLK